MKHFWRICLILSLYNGVLQADTLTDSPRTTIGSTFSAPVKYSDKFYFVATTGVLFETSDNFKSVTKLFDGKKQTIGSVILAGGRVYWGDGLHTDKKSKLHIYDLKSKKLIKSIEVSGHIERSPLFHQNTLYLPLGPGGVMAINSENLKIKWQTKEYKDKPLHVDSNILAIGDKVCASTIYDLKGVVCLNKNTGKVTQLSQLSRDPKSEITLWKDHVVGFATEGDLTKAKWDVPADLYIYGVKKDKMKMSKELRGFNFFAPQIIEDQAFITLSTGDFITMNLNDGKISFLGEFPEPFTNNAFIKGSDYCGIGIMGKYLCYTKTKAGFALSMDKRLMETVIGKVTFQSGKLIVPTRAGYFVE